MMFQNQPYTVSPVFESLQRAGEHSTAISGYIGAATDDHITLYRDRSLSSYLKIPVNALVYSEPSDDPRVASRFYVRDSAAIEFGRSDSFLTSPPIQLTRSGAAKIAELRATVFGSLLGPSSVGVGPEKPESFCEIQSEQLLNQCLEGVPEGSDEELWCWIEHVIRLDECKREKTRLARSRCSCRS